MGVRVIVVVRVPGFHNWPDAPEPVAYLRARHRHLFTVRVEFDVTHDDRDVEFHIAQGWIRASFMRRLGGAPFEFGARSCEQIAHEVAVELKTFHRAPCAVEVWEDDENGARVEFAQDGT